MGYLGYVIVIAILLVGIGILGFYVWRLRRVLSRRGSFQAVVRQSGHERWHRGVAVFERFQIDWYPSRSLRFAASQTWKRSDIELEVHPETTSDLQVVKFETPRGTWYMASTPVAVAAIVSWMDAAPPVEEPTDW
ncbi:DUF2550 family protein [Arcanobacterium canis]